MVIIPRHPGKYKGEFEVEEIIEFMGITFHLSPGQRACFKYEDGTYTGYASNRTKLDTFFPDSDRHRGRQEATSVGGNTAEYPEIGGADT